MANTKKIQLVERSKEARGRLGFLLLAMLLLLVGAWPGRAQSSDEAASEQDSEAEERFKVEVREVQIPFSVFDKDDNLVLDLKKEDFIVLENGVAQEIQYFSQPVNLPLRFGILIDTSSSARQRLKFEKEAAMQLGYYVLSHSKDHQGFLMTFDHGPDVVQDFTVNPDDLTMALDQLQAAGGTALLDAIVAACEKNLQSAPGPGIPRRVLVIFSDGEDNMSKHSLQQAIDVALRADVRVFAVSSNGYGQNAPGEEVLKKLVQETNGKLYTPLNEIPSAAFATGYISKGQISESQNSVYKEGTGQYSSELAISLTNALEAIGHELANQYAVGYLPKVQALDGSFRNVEVRTRRKSVEIRAKKGYYAVPNGAALQPPVATP